MTSHSGLAQTVAPTPGGTEAPASRQDTSAPVVVNAGSTAAAETDEDETIELSPFIIVAEEDEGYLATSNISGTRLRTEMRDIAGSISVMTKEFMDDLAADDLSTLALYALGTEVGGIDGNFSDTNVFDASQGYVNDENSRRGSSAPSIRVRGLSGGADRTRDYFITTLPGDRYNVERIDVQRGPNGMLYGLGSPSGVINEGTIKANPRRVRTSVSTRFDDRGSYRVALDHNQVLMQDRIALRVAGLYNDQAYQIEEAFNRSHRAYATLTFKPFESTTIRASGEKGSIWANPPRTLPPYDYFTHWWAVGQPVWNAFTGTTTYLGTPSSNPAVAAVNWLVNIPRGNQASLIIENPDTGDFGVSLPSSHPDAIKLFTLRPRRNPANTGWAANGRTTVLADGVNYVRAIRGLTNADLTWRFYRRPQITDPEVFDFYHHQLDGNARSRDARWDTQNVTLEQRLGNNAGFELAYDRQAYDESFRDWAQFGNYSLKIDTTSVFIDGTPNPNFGRPHVGDAFPASNRTTDREAFRATIYYDLDLKDKLSPGGLLGKILGRHTFTANYTRQTNEINRFYGNAMLELDYWNFLAAGVPNTLKNAGTQPRMLNAIAYVGPSLIGAASPQDADIRPVMGSFLDRIPQTISIYDYPTPPANATVAPSWGIYNFDVINAASRWDNSAYASQLAHTRDVYKSATLVAQSRWFENSFISTLGWRRDWINTWDAGGATFDPATGLAILDPDVYFLKPRLDQRHDSFNYGLVWHLPDFVQDHLPLGMEVSLTYNDSDNFTPQAERLNVYGESIDPTAGSTKEYGAIVSLLDRKIQLRAVHYETESTGATEAAFTNGAILNMDRQMFDILSLLYAGEIDFFPDGNPTTASKQALLDFLRDPVATPFYSTEVAGYYIDASGLLQGNRDRTIGRVFATSDVAAEGWEFDVTANPTKSWRVTFNVAKQSTIKTNSGNELNAMLESWDPFLDEGPAGALPAVASGTATVRDRYLNWKTVVNRVRSQNGARSPELREWRFNFVNNFTFNEGLLKGWGVGGAVRWQDKVVIGYPIIDVAGEGQYDITRPFWGPRETNVDAWISYRRKLFEDRVDWRVQLNVRNLGEGNKLIPVNAQPDGATDTFRIAANEVWSLSNTFSF